MAADAERTDTALWVPIGGGPPPRASSRRSSATGQPLDSFEKDYLAVCGATRQPTLSRGVSFQFDIEEMDAGGSDDSPIGSATVYMPPARASSLRKRPADRVEEAALTTKAVCFSNTDVSLGLCGSPTLPKAGSFRTLQPYSSARESPTTVTKSDSSNLSGTRSPKHSLRVRHASSTGADGGKSWHGSRGDAKTEFTSSLKAGTMRGSRSRQSTSVSDPPDIVSPKSALQRANRSQTAAWEPPDVTTPDSFPRLKSRQWTAGATDLHDTMTTLMDPNATTTRRLRRRSLSILSPSAVLRALGVQRLLALREGFRALDESGDGALSRGEFYVLWRCACPDRPIDADLWLAIDCLYSDMDEDCSESVSFDEIVHYLAVHNKTAMTFYSPRPRTCKEWAWQLCKPDPVAAWEGHEADRFKLKFIRLWRALSQLCVLASILNMMVESLPEMQRGEDHMPGTTATLAVECVCVAVFTLDLIFWVVGYPSKTNAEVDSDDEEGLGHSSRSPQGSPAAMAATAADRSQVRHRWRHLMSEPSTWIDVASVLPFYLSNVPWIINAIASGGGDRDGSKVAPLGAVRMVRLLRLFRILRVLRLGRGRFGEQLEVGAAMKRSFLSLNFLFVLIIIAVVLSASFAFFLEQDQATFNMTRREWVRDRDSEYVDAGQATHIQSIPESLWWALVTITTVGYGDLKVQAAGTKTLAAVTMFIGVNVMAFPVTILSSTFQTLNRRKKEQQDRELLCAEFFKGILSWADQGAPMPGQDKDRERDRSQFTGKPLHLSPAAITQLQGSMAALSHTFEDSVGSFQRRCISRLDGIEGRLDRIESAARRMAGE